MVKKIARRAARAVNKITPITKKELKFLESLLEKRFLNFGVEPTNLCNARCPYCAYRFSKKSKNTMPLELYEKVIKQYDSLGGGGINLTPTIGDPLVDKTIIDKIKIAKKYPNITNVFFYTNLLGLNNFDVKELLSSGIDRISVSTAIGLKAMYSRLFGVDRYDLMFANLIKLLETNRDLKKPVNIILALRHDKSFDVASSGDYKRILGLIDRKKITQIPNERGYDNWGGVIENKDLPKEAVFRKSERERIEPCGELYRRINILADGAVNFCICRDFNYEMTIGNINSDGLLDIWRGAALKKLRDDWKIGRNIPEICRNCSSYEPLSKLLEKSRINIWRLLLRRKNW